MNIDVKLADSRVGNVIPGNKHVLDERGRPIGADAFRVDMTMILPAEPSELRADFEQVMRPEHVRPGEAYGLVLMSSQLLPVMHVATPALVEAWRDKPFRLPSGLVYGGWPGYNPSLWEDVIPQTTWFPKGLGILDELDGVNGAKVTVYEYTVDEAQVWNDRAEPAGKLINMVTFHCSRCHFPAPFDSGEKWENRGPVDRAWAHQKARVHARGQGHRCEPRDGEMERVVAQVASEMHGRAIELPGPDAACAAAEGCAQVREARAATMLLAAA